VLIGRYPPSSYRICWFSFWKHELDELDSLFLSVREFRDHEAPPAENTGGGVPAEVRQRRDLQVGNMGRVFQKALVLLMIADPSSEKYGVLGVGVQVAAVFVKPRHFGRRESVLVNEVDHLLQRSPRRRRIQVDDTSVEDVVTLADGEHLVETAEHPLKVAPGKNVVRIC